MDEAVKKCPGSQDDCAGGDTASVNHLDPFCSPSGYNYGSHNALEDGQVGTALEPPLHAEPVEGFVTLGLGACTAAPRLLLSRRN